MGNYAIKLVILNKTSKGEIRKAGVQMRRKEGKLSLIKIHYGKKQ